MNRCKAFLIVILCVLNILLFIRTLAVIIAVIILKLAHFLLIIELYLL